MAENKLMPIDEAPIMIFEATGWTPSKQTIKAWIKKERIKGKQVGGRWFVEKDSITEMLAETS